MHGTATLKIIDPSGHTEITWDMNVPDEVRAAREAFDNARSKGYSCFEIKRNGKPGPRMDTFDPKAESLMMVPQLQGG